MINSKKIMKGLLGATALTALSAGTAFAQATPNDFTAAGTEVSNTFTLDYSVGGVEQPPIDSADGSGVNGPTLFTVDRLVNLTVESDGNNNVAPGAINEDLVFSVLNTGNDTQDYALTIVEETDETNEFDTDAPTSATPILVALDTDGDGILDVAERNAAVAYDPTDPPQLAPDEVLFVIVEQNIPAEAVDGQQADVSLIADTLDANTTTPTVADADGTNVITGDAENVLADGTSTNNEGANQGDDSATGTYVIAAADIDAIKTVTVFSEDGANCATIPGTSVGGFGIPGSCVEYVITVTNSGSEAATDIVVNDILPPELEFSAATTFGFTGGTFTLPNLPAVGDDCGLPVGNCEVNFTGATLDAPTGAATAATGTVTIRAIVK